MKVAFAWTIGGALLVVDDESNEIMFSVRAHTREARTALIDRPSRENLAKLLAQGLTEIPHPYEDVPAETDSGNQAEPDQN